MTDLTSRQRQILDFIRDQLEDSGRQLTDHARQFTADPE